MLIKKQAVDLTELAFSVVVLGLVVSIGINVLIVQRDARLGDLPTYQEANETLTTVTESGESFAIDWVSSVTDCVNSSSGTHIDDGNYTVTINENGVGTSKIAFSSADAGDILGFNNTDWKCTYQISNVSRPDWALADQAASGIGEYGNWFKTIVIVGVAAVVLSLIFMAFGRGSKAGSIGGSY